MTAFIRNHNEQSLSQRAGQPSVGTSHTETETPIRVEFWRWQFWNERGNGEWDRIFLSHGDARELAYSILEELGKVNKHGAEGKSGNQGSGEGISPPSSGSAPTAVDVAAGGELSGVSVPPS
jgi:hypothetical protein